MFRQHGRRPSGRSRRVVDTADASVSRSERRGVEDMRTSTAAGASTRVVAASRAPAVRRRTTTTRTSSGRWSIVGGSVGCSRPPTRPVDVTSAVHNRIPRIADAAAITDASLGGLQRRRLRPLGRRRAGRTSRRHHCQRLLLLPHTVAQARQRHVFYDRQSPRPSPPRSPTASAKPTPRTPTPTGQRADSQAGDEIPADSKARSAGRTPALRWWRPSPSRTICWSTPGSRTRPLRASQRCRRGRGPGPR